AIDKQSTRVVLPDELSRSLSTLFRRHYLTIFPQTTANEWRVVKTIAGDSNQPVRHDFPPPLAGVGAVDLAALPAELLLATQDDTAIYGFGYDLTRIPFAWIEEASFVPWKFGALYGGLGHQ
ncbi:hypothetical protein F441_13571, partial [Phytophthora nicotianae CJ01A1]